jgi:hypothetical protein
MELEPQAAEYFYGVDENRSNAYKFLLETHTPM